MELRQLRYLRAVVRMGTVTAAAGQEHVAQPSVSKQLRALERETGVPLFHRVGRRVVPTEAGIHLAACAARVLDDLEATVASIAGPDSAVSGRLRICATETVANHLLPRALAALRAGYPRARISVEMLGTDDALGRLLEDAADMAFVVLPLTDARLEVHELLEEEVWLALTPGHPWAQKERVPLIDALAAPGLLLSMPGHGLRAQIDGEARAHGIGLEPAIELRSQQALLSMVEAGGGVAFAPRMSLEPGRGIVARPLTPGLRRQLGWVRLRGRHLPPSARALIGLIGQEVPPHAGSMVEVSPHDSSRPR